MNDSNPDPQFIPADPDALTRDGQRVLREAADAVNALADRLDSTFAQAVAAVLACRGRVVVTGMGKSGHVGRKMAATLASTGTPALFLHPGEARHGDLGMVASGDVVIALSYSGESDELTAILPALKRRAELLIAVTGNPQSTLARAAQIVLDVSVPREACPHNLAPTTSTTATIALGDALAVSAMRGRAFSRADYARLHPAGSLGRRLTLHVADLMRTGDELAVVDEAATLHDALFAITRARAGAACVTDQTGKLSGLLTDGDVRRFLLRTENDGSSPLTRPVREAMTHHPRTVTPDLLAAEAVLLFRGEPDKNGDPGAARIGDLPVVGGEGRPVGMLMFKDLGGAGIVLGDGE